MQAHAAAEIDAVPPGSFRGRVLESARRFKASWVDLARHLVRVKGEGLFEEWGYGSFEAYCARELRIKKTTAQKLVMSYGFLERREPRALADDAAAQRAPSFEVIEVLSRAEERGQLDDETYREVRDRLWERPVEPRELEREIKKRFPEPPPPEEPADLGLRRLAAAARKLARELAAETRVPRGVTQRATALADDVEALLRHG